MKLIEQLQALDALDEGLIEPVKKLKVPFDRLWLLPKIPEMGRKLIANYTIYDNEPMSHVFAKVSQQGNTIKVNNDGVVSDINMVGSTVVLSKDNETIAHITFKKKLLGHLAYQKLFIGGFSYKFKIRPSLIGGSLVITAPDKTVVADFGVALTSHANMLTVAKEFSKEVQAFILVAYKIQQGIVAIY